MPRPPIDEANEPEPVEPSQRFVQVTVSAPDYDYSGATVVLQGEVVSVHNRAGNVIGTYTLDRPPTIDYHGERFEALLGVVDGVALIVRPDPSCTCHGTRKQRKP